MEGFAIDVNGCHAKITSSAAPANLGQHGTFVVENMVTWMAGPVGMTKSEFQNESMGLIDSVVDQ